MILKIVVDIDNTLINTFDAISKIALNYYNISLNQPVIYTEPEAIIPDALPPKFANKSKREVFDYLINMYHLMIEDFPPFDYAVDILNEISQDKTISILYITEHKNVWGLTGNWLKKYGFPYPQNYIEVATLEQRKDIIRNDQSICILIDDNPIFLEWASEIVTCISLCYPYNKYLSMSDVFLVDDWNEIGNLLSIFINNYKYSCFNNVFKS